MQGVGKLAPIPNYRRVVESGTLVPAVRLDGYQAASLLGQLQARGTPLATELWKKVHRAWTCRGIAPEVAIPLSARELQLVRKLGASTREPKLVNYRYMAIYCHTELNQEVRVKSHDRPPKRRTFRVSGQGRKKFTRKKLYRITTNTTKESSTHMAKKTAKTKAKAKSAPVAEPDELEDELEGLEELDDVADEEPEAEVDEAEEEETPKRKRGKKTSTKAAPKSKRAKKAAAVEEDDEDEEDDDDEEEEPVAKKKSSKKDTKGKAKGKAKGPTGAAGKTTAEATGGVGTSELAEAASEIAEVDITGRDVRVYLRREAVPKDEEHGRYVWPSKNNKAFKKLAKAIASEFEDDE